MNVTARLTEVRVTSVVGCGRQETFDLTVDKAGAFIANGVAVHNSGKTVIIAEIARLHLERGGKVLVVVHRRELVQQTQRKLADAGVELVGVIAAGSDQFHNAPVLVASVQTMLARNERPDGVTLLILDECHHYLSAEWKAVAAQYPAAHVVGVTATPERGDGSPLGDIFEEIAHVVQTPDLIEIGALVPVDVVAPGRAVKGLCADPVDAWAEHAGHRAGILFAESVDAAKRCAAGLVERGIKAAAIWGAMAAGARAVALDAFRAGELDVLTTVFVLTEGFDAPRAEVCMIARGCGHAGTYLQMVGRVLRPCAGKSRALVIDLKGCSHEHGNPDERRVFSLEGKAISGAQKPTKTCPSCGEELARTKMVCPECSHVFAVKGRPAGEVDLTPLVKLTIEQRERLYFDRMVGKARELGYKPGWAVYRFEQRFGRKPWKMYREIQPQKETGT